MREMPFADQAIVLGLNYPRPTILIDKTQGLKSDVDGLLMTNIKS